MFPRRAACAPALRQLQAPLASGHWQRRWGSTAEVVNVCASARGASLNRASCRPGIHTLQIRDRLLDQCRDTPYARLFEPRKRGRNIQALYHSTLINEKDSGHISTEPNESVLFFDNLFPLKLNYLLRRPWQSDKDLSELVRGFESPSLGVTDPIKLVKRATKDLPLKITEIFPRLKDGGAFVKFSYPEGTSPKDIEAQLSEALENSPIKPWFNPFTRIKAKLVKGTPWLEDLYRFPKSRVKVEFIPPSPGESAVELSQEDLYSLFRRYGKIAEITSQPSDSKMVPRFAYVDFGLLRDAIMARNCMHGFVVSEAQGGGKVGTRLRMSYERKVRAHSIWNWITTHPRLVIPLIAAVLAAITVVVFDPIRKFFVKTYIKHRTSLVKNKLYSWAKSRTENLFRTTPKEKKADLSSVWNQRRGLIEDLQTGMMEPTETFIVVLGPRGSGKEDLVDQALKGRKNILTIDCKPVVEARGESGTIRKLAAAVGYRPIFSWANSISSMIDLAVQSTTGVKAGFSETLEAQLAKILHTTASALKDVSLSERSETDAGSEDAFLEAHPENRAVVVIDNFLHKIEESKAGSSVVYDKMAEWAAALVQNNIAHVIFLTSDASFSKVLGKALPDRVFHQISLGDVPPDVAEKFILSRLEEDEHRQKKARQKAQKDGDEKAVARPKPDLAELGSCIQTIGGRLTDLELFATRLKGGQRPRQAIEEIVNQSATEIVKNFLLAKDADKNSSFSPEQAWYLVKSLAHAKDAALPYHDTVLSASFSASGGSPETVLDSLASAELISLKSRKGLPITITAGKPIYQAAFHVLANDATLRAKMDLAILGMLAKKEAEGIEKAERELSLLGGLPKQPGELAGRVRYLLAKVEGGQSKIVALEREMAGLKRALQK